MIKGVLFDFDGVLVPIDAELKRKIREEIVKESCARLPLTRQQAIAHLDQALTRSTHMDPYLKLQDAALQLGSFRRDEINELFHRISRERKIKLEDTIIDMLRCLKVNGLVLGIVTLSSKERIEGILQNIGIKEYFDSVDSASKEFLKAPHSDWKKSAYHRFLDKYKFQASEVLCVGDTPDIDLLPAKSLGMETVLVIHDDNRELVQERLADNVLYRDTLCETLPLLIINTNSTRRSSHS